MVPIKFVEFFFWYGEVIIDFIIFLIILISYSHSENVSNKRKINPVNYTHPNSSTTKLGYMYTLIWSPHTILNWWPYLSNHYYHIYIFLLTKLDGYGTIDPLICSELSKNGVKFYSSKSEKEKDKEKKKSLCTRKDIK